MLKDSFIINKIGSMSDVDSDYWAFRKRSKRDYCHGLMTYPAMMVPEMQGELIDILLDSQPSMSSVYDPFVGSGTVMGETILRGINFFGTDVNPLAILCCESKSDYFCYESAVENLEQIKDKLNSTLFEFEIVNFEGVEKWFDNSSLVALSKIRSSIKNIDSIWCRRFFWVSFVDIVRKYSNTRLSTYKLHIRSDRENIKIENVYSTFIEKAEKNIKLKNKFWNELKSRGVVEKDELKVASELLIKDVRNLDDNFQVDLVVTSPPYGDNATTVTYGQYSYLPLKFIDLNDIDADFDRGLTSTQSAIDAASLGGSLKDWKEKKAIVEKYSETLRKSLDDLDDLNNKGLKKLSSFSYDLFVSLTSISKVVKVNGLLMFTLGNRKINKKEIPLHLMVKELLESLGMREVLTFDRKIPNKRMPGSMSSEYILIMRKM